ncbi:cell division protein ZapE [Luteimonas fraxinea]|uniref:Cell division protein ZapE n=1 Tax=Luteimonas fraxinea TaxID=2901869 RepID=A0ABS8UCN0_9GAMM|nr:cell division protein ZapE [Luteimonas fraxinea]MCD9097266.1 cell division protein ZapE [Luteimonas fraxinea]MCD9125169.1 cell division protein ZapE [Luteimonas fraxinea]
MSALPTPSERYAAGVSRGDWQSDPAQQPALVELDRLHAALIEPPARRGMLGRLFGSGDAPDVPAGLYLWGGVGRGKTFMIDLFHDGLPLQSMRSAASDDATPAPAVKDPARHATPDPKLGRKRRTHFHRFMREVHESLRAHSGERDPLAAIVRGWRDAGLRVLVLDEFFVSDIGDAMLLARLLDRMFADGIVLVTSSNVDPKDLYKDGLQRARFMPAIELLQRHTRVVYLESDTDYRMRALTRSPVYRTPLDADSDSWLDTRWHELGGDDEHRDAGVEIDGRRICVRARTPGMAWFDFDALCEGPRGASDYIQVATEFHTVLLGGIPHMDATRDDAARRFVTLIDELYDRHVNLVCTAAAEPPALYSGERLTGAFERTASRLIEMRSAEYLAREHRG